MAHDETTTTAPERPRRRRLRYVRRGVYGLLALVFLVAYAAAYLPPRWFWWTGVLAVSVPYLSLLLVLLSPLVLWRFRAAGRLLHVALLVLVALRFVVPAMPLARAAPVDGDLVFMTFNAPVRGPNPDTLRRATIGLVRSASPDLLALQEPAIWWEGTPPQRRLTAHAQALVDSLGYGAYTGEATSGELHQPILARLVPERVEHIVLTPEEDAASHVTRMEFRWRDRAFVVYNLHLFTTGERKPWQEAEPRPFDPLFWRPFVQRYRDAYARRVEEARTVRMLLERETLPVIVAGDFNSTIHHWEYRHVARGLKNAFTEAGQGWGATYHARLPLVRIDHVLTGPAWEVVSAHVPDGHALSDHRPVVVRLRWREGP